jgi:hypothetical protein
MFLNCEWPAMRSISSPDSAQRVVPLNAPEALGGG